MIHKGSRTEKYRGGSSVSESGGSEAGGFSVGSSRHVVAGGPGTSIIIMMSGQADVASGGQGVQIDVVSNQPGGGIQQSGRRGSSGSLTSQSDTSRDFSRGEQQSSLSSHGMVGPSLGGQVGGVAHSGQTDIGGALGRTSVPEQGTTGPLMDLKGSQLEARAGHLGYHAARQDRPDV